MVIFVLLFIFSLLILQIMSYTCSEELAKGLVQSGCGNNVTGTAIDLEALFPANAAKTFDEITVFNDADRPVKVEWTNDVTGNSDYFFVPHGGKSFTHKLNKGAIATTSLKLYSYDATVATGNITINLSRNHS